MSDNNKEDTTNSDVDVDVSEQMTEEHARQKWERDTAEWQRRVEEHLEIKSRMMAVTDPLDEQ